MKKKQKKFCIVYDFVVIIEQLMFVFNEIEWKSNNWNTFGTILYNTKRTCKNMHSILCVELLQTDQLINLNLLLTALQRLYAKGSIYM